MSAPRPRILYLASSWPGGRAFGGQLRALHLGRALREIGEVTLLVVGSEAGNVEARARSAQQFPTLPPVYPVLDPNHDLIRKLRCAFDPRYLNIHGCRATAADRARVQELRGQFDLIWLLNSRTPNILDIYHWPRAHLDIDDLPGTYLRAAARNGSDAFTRWKCYLQQVLMKRRERRLEQRFTTLSVCSEDDRRYLGAGGSIHVIPNGFERPAREPQPCPASAPPRLGFIGLFSYPPNLEGMRWFLRHCWPAIRQAVPGIRLRLVGQDTDGPLRPADPDVDALGWLADPAAEIATWSAMVIPIRVGGGTRVKLADAFSRKCPVVATSVGAYGYEVQDGQQLRLADEPAAFARACVELVRHPAAAAAMAERAWREFLEKWTWEAIAPRVWKAAEDCLRRSNTPFPGFPADAPRAGVRPVKASLP
jgi:glycosyltransferase involved in cell wall biosynthesis